jgi:hypothetical protein
MPDTTKNNKFSQEQTQMLDRLLGILYSLSNNFQDNRRHFIFLLCDLDENIEVQGKIMDLRSEIRRVYSSSGCIGITHTDKCKRPYLSIIRFLLKQHNKDLSSCDYCIALGNHQYKRTKKYRIFP